MKRIPRRTFTTKQHKQQGQVYHRSNINHPAPPCPPS